VSDRLPRNEILIDWEDFKLDIGDGTTIALSRAHYANYTSTILMLPGFTSKRRNSTNVDVANRLAGFGIQCIVADLSGHGDSSGDIEDQTVLRAAAEIASLLERLTVNGITPPGQRIAVLANSFSANAALLVAAERSDLSAIVLKSPVVDYFSMRAAQLGDAKMEQWRVNRWIRLNDGTPSKYAFIEDALKANSYEAIEKVSCPLLAVHGGEDNDIPKEQIEKFRSRLLKLGQQHVIFIDADHGISGHNFKPCMELFVGFLLEHLIRRGDSL